MLNSIARDGKLYCLPCSAQVRDIVYNTILFEEKGWKVPYDFNRFIALCRTIGARGIRSIHLGFVNSELLDTAFVGYSYGNGFSTPADAQWLADYNRGRGSFGEHFRPALNTFQTMIDTGVWKKSDLSLTYAERETRLFNHQCAMVEDSVLMARRGVRPHRLHRSVRAHAFLQPRHPLRLGPPLYGVLYRFEQTSGRTPEQKEIRSRHAVDGLHQHAGRAARPGSEHGGHVFQRKESPRAGYPGNCGHAPGLEPRAVRHLS